eukprot:gene8012-8838_t
MVHPNPILSLFAILSFSLWHLIFANKTLYIHIGPHKSGSTHIQTVFTRLAANLSHYGVCWAANRRKGFHRLATKFSNEDNLNRSNELFAGINDCLAHHPVTIISSETFVRLQPESIRHLRDLFASQDVQIRIVAVYRDWLMRVYSAYGEFSKRSYSTLCTFQYFLSVIFDLPTFRYFTSDIVSLLKGYEEVFGYDALTIIDYAGVSAAGKDIAAVLICEMLKVPCAELPDVFHEQENAAREKSAYEVLMLFREMAWMRGCTVNPVYDALRIAIGNLDGLAREYESYLDLLPTYHSRFEPWKVFSLKQRQEFDLHYANRTLYSNSEAALPTLMNFSLPLIDYEQLHSSITFQQILKAEVSKLISRNVFVNCSGF